jgi:hypothetical protein
VAASLDPGQLLAAAAEIAPPDRRLA